MSSGFNLLRLWLHQNPIEPLVQTYGSCVFELGSPDRKAGEFRHGDDFWSPAVAPKVGFPTPVWGGAYTYTPIAAAGKFSISARGDCTTITVP